MEPQRFVCDWCGKGYATDAGLKQHKSRYCKPDAALAADLACTDCGRSFGTKAGLSLHRRRAHVAEYQGQLEREDTRSRTIFSDLEVAEILREELKNNNINNINQHLADRFGSNPTVIRNLRRSQRYKSLRDDRLAIWPTVPP